ncbi:MAG: HAMP domain-containing histidine kinase [Candidatus Moranbacteria bacterium]|nr:HAMP domain-containing histidine kinase [Candidatus Moranbacteria bacterium]
MKKTIARRVQDEARRYGVPFWKLPDFLILTMAFVNILGMLFTYYLALNFVDDPRTAVIFVAIESAIILIIGNIVAESSRKVIANYRLKEEFIDLVSHQIRNPITNVKWNLELLGQEELSKKQEKYVDRLAGSVKNIVSLVNDFVYLSRLEQSKKELTLQKIDIKKVVQDLLKEMKLFASSRDIKLKFVNNSENYWARTDLKKIKIVINNVVENALKYSYEKGEVGIELHNKKDRLIIKTNDNGCGIDDESQSFVFDKFFRALDAKKLAADGTGVGLYVSKILLKEMEGEIWFESEKDEGSTFYISLPVYG